MEYGDIRPGLISKESKKGGEGKKLWEGRGKKGERGKCGRGGGKA